MPLQSVTTPLRVMQLIPSWNIGGAEIFVLHLSRELQVAGCEVSVVSWRDCGPLETKFRRCGIETVNLNASGRFDPAAAFRLMRTINTSGCGVVHAHLFPIHWWLSLLPTGKNVRLVFTEHNITNRRRKKAAARIVEHFVYPRFDNVIAVSAGVEKSLLRWQPHLSNVRTLFNGIPDNPLPGEKNPARSHHCCLLFVGRLVRAKGLDTLLEACRILKADGFFFKLDVAGDGPERARLEQYCRRHSLNDRVRFHGFVDDAEKLLVTRPVFVQPSRWEGLPLATLEAMRSACPIVAAPVGGLSEVLENGSNALLVAPDSPELLAGAVAELLESPVLAEKLGDNARIDFQQNYTIGICARRHWMLYRGMPLD
ncbi:MAG: glycosyltransferase family 4 protein [Gammaproteobacteria bacterium]